MIKRQRNKTWLALVKIVGLLTALVREQIAKCAHVVVIIIKIQKIIYCGMVFLILHTRSEL